MIIAVASGKGGTGKTTVAVNWALSMEGAQLLDCDVEAPNAHIFLRPELTSTEEVSLPVPVIDKALCDYCGRCAEVCEFKALNVFKKEGGGSVAFLEHLCHNCGACTLFCPKGAITERPKGIGFIDNGTAGGVLYSGGRMNIGEIKSPALIKKLKEKIDRTRTVILDCPPGAACPMVAAVSGSDFCVLVTEPTPFGLHDLTIAAETVRRLGIPFGVLVNRAEEPGAVEAWCAAQSVPLLGRLPFDRQVAELYSSGRTFLAEKPQYTAVFREALLKIKKLLEGSAA